MLIPGGSYTISPNTREITLFPPFNSITTEQIVSIYNLTNKIFVYDAENLVKRVSIYSISVSAGVIKYTYDKHIFANTDILQIHISTGTDGGTP